MKVSLFLFSLLSLGLVLGQPVRAGTVSVAAFDTDSYLFFGTDNRTDPHITLNPHAEEHSHFNFGIIRFPLEDLEGEGPYYLALHLPFFVTGSIEEGFATTDTGEAEISVVALGGDFGRYLQPDVSKRAWYDLHLHGRPVIGSIAFASENGDGIGWYYLDVTETVEAWRARPETHFGFGLYGVSGSVDLDSSDGDPATAPRLVDALPLSYDDWKASVFTPDQREDDQTSGWDADPDRDGRHNGWEYHQATDPTTAEPLSAWGEVVTANGTMAWRASAGAHRSDGRMIVESTRNLETWSEVADTVRNEEMDTVRVELDPTAGRFLRLRLVRP
jgi:hypothetical protein